MNDQELVALIRTGKSDKALKVLYDSFPMVRRLLFNHGAGYADAEDIFQEALIIFCRNVIKEDFELRSQLNTYLYGICRFLWKDELKRRSKPLPPDPGQDGPDVAEAVEREQRARLAEQVVAALGERCKELLMLFYEAGLRWQDIAARMGYSSAHTAKNQKYKCIETAKVRLKQLSANIQSV